MTQWETGVYFMIKSETSNKKLSNINLLIKQLKLYINKSQLEKKTEVLIDNERMHLIENIINTNNNKKFNCITYNSSLFSRAE